MTNTDTADAAGTAAQIESLARAGSQIVRVTVNNEESAAAVPAIVDRLEDMAVRVPIIGDFHYNGHLLLTRYPACARALAKYRINPGNVGGKRRDENFRAIIEIALVNDKPVRIGVNWGSLDQNLLTEMMDTNASLPAPRDTRAVVLDAMVESALQSAALAEATGMSHDRIVLSAKVSGVQELIAVYRELATRGDYALHLGLTEAGIGSKGIVASTACTCCLRVATRLVVSSPLRTTSALVAGAPAAHGTKSSPHRDAVKQLYVHNDALVGRVMAQLGDDDVLMVISDHGFSSFRRGVNLNSWLRQQGYLVLKEGADPGAEWLRDVDWPATRAYCLGLTGMFLNIEGREASGSLPPGAEATRLKAEIIGKLNGLRDAARNEVGIREVFDTSSLYAGPYLENAPDLLIGYNAGYRTSWDCATGVVDGPVFEDNVKAWSGDHCIDPRLVPGVFFCNRKIDARDPSLIDIAPTALRLFGVEPPSYMDGRPFAVAI